MEKKIKRYPTLDEIAEFLEGHGKRVGECLEWTGKGKLTPRGGYQFSFGGRGGKLVLVHRLALEHFLGFHLGPGVRVLRECKNIKCIEPLHMSIGSFRLMNHDKPELPELWGDDDYPSLLRIASKLKNAGTRDNGCLLWDDALDPQGYGVVSFVTKGKQHLHRVHRLAFELHHGRRIKPGLVINHLCGVRRCFSPYHLEEVTQAENVRYALKLRSGNSTGYLHVQKHGDRFRIVMVKDGKFYKRESFATAQLAHAAAVALREELGIKVAPALNVL